MNLPFYFYCLALAILVGACNYKHLKAPRLHLFLPFLVLTLVVELVAYYIKHHLDQSTGPIYNAYVFIQVLFCTLFFRNAYLQPQFKKILDAGIGVYLITTVIIYTTQTSFNSFSTWLFLLGGFLVALSGLFFLFSYFLLDNAPMEAILHPVIFISIGIIAYFTVLSITVSFLEQIISNHLHISGVMLHNFLPRMMSIILYLSFAYAFHICRKILPT